MTILRRYIFRETLQVWLVVTLVLLAILLANQFASVLGDAAEGQVPQDAVTRVMGLSTLQYLTILVPAAFLLGVMLALARLYRDSEMAAMMACGIGPGTVYRAIAPLVLLLGAGLAWLALEGAPWAIREIQAIELELQREVSLGVLEPGRFISVGDPDTVLYAERADADGTLGNLFIQRLRANQIVEVVLAERGERRIAADGRSHSVILYNGRRYEGVPGQLEFRVIEFAEHGIPLPPIPDEVQEVPVGGRSVERLVSEPHNAHLVELHWRAAVPIGLVVLAVVAVPLARTPPRSGRYGRVAFGVLVYLLYTNLLTAGRVWLEREIVPMWLGLWWVHGAVLALGLLLLARELGWGRRAPRAPRGRGGGR